MEKQLKVGIFRYRIVRRRSKRLSRRRSTSAVLRRAQDKNKFLNHKEAARELVLARLAHYNGHYKLNWGRVSIKNTKSRWGSCSKKGNLNFNYRLALIDPALADYVVVHELCHLQEFNHSQKFWNLVAETVPDYKEKREALRKIKL